LTDAYFTDRYPGFDLDDPDWPTLARQVPMVDKLLETVGRGSAANAPDRARITATNRSF